VSFNNLSKSSDRRVLCQVFIAQSSIVNRQSSIVNRQFNKYLTKHYSLQRPFARPSGVLIGGILLLNSFGSWANTSDVTIPSTASFTVASSPLGGKTGCAMNVGIHSYASQKFSPVIGASTDIETTAASLVGGMSSSDTFIAFYSPSFDPASPTTNLISCNDDSVGGLSKITYTLVAGTQYEIVVTTYDPGVTGTATLSFTPDVTLLSSVNNTVSAPLFSLKEKAAVFSEEVK